MKKLFIIILNIIIYLNIFAQYNRIVSLNLSSDEMLLALAPKENIVALSGKLNQDEIMSNIISQAKDFPVIEKNLEVLLSMEPDFVIAPDWLDNKFLSSIRDNDIKLYVYKTPKNLKEQMDLILDLGDALGYSKKANEIVNDMKKRLEIMQEKTKKLKFRPKVMLYTAFQTTSDDKTSFHDLVVLNNAINPVAGSGVSSFEKISKEKVIELNPDIIVVPTWDSQVDKEKFFNYLLNDPSLSEVTAIKNRHVFNIPYKDISSTSQNMIIGVEKVGEIILEVAK